MITRLINPEAEVRVLDLQLSRILTEEESVGNSKPNLEDLKNGPDQTCILICNLSTTYHISAQLTMLQNFSQSGVTHWRRRKHHRSIALLSFHSIKHSLCLSWNLFKKMQVGLICSLFEVFVISQMGFMAQHRLQIIQRLVLVLPKANI